MTKNIQITANNIVRHFMNKLGYKVTSVVFTDPIECEYDFNNPEMIITTDKDFIWNSKSYKVFRRCEDKLITKFGMNLDIIDQC